MKLSYTILQKEEQIATTDRRRLVDGCLPPYKACWYVWRLHQTDSDNDLQFTKTKQWRVVHTI